MPAECCWPATSVTAPPAAWEAWCMAVATESPGIGVPAALMYSVEGDRTGGLNDFSFFR